MSMGAPSPENKLSACPTKTVPDFCDSIDNSLNILEQNSDLQTDSKHLCKMCNFRIWTEAANVKTQY